MLDKARQAPLLLLSDADIQPIGRKENEQRYLQRLGCQPRLLNGCARLSYSQPSNHNLALRAQSWTIGTTASSIVRVQTLPAPGRHPEAPPDGAFEVRFSNLPDRRGVLPSQAQALAATLTANLAASKLQSRARQHARDIPGAAAPLAAAKPDVYLLSARGDSSHSLADNGEEAVLRALKWRTGNRSVPLGDSPRSEHPVEGWLYEKPDPTAKLALETQSAPDLATLLSITLLKADLQPTQPLRFVTVNPDMALEVEATASYAAPKEGHQQVNTFRFIGTKGGRGADSRMAAVTVISDVLAGKPLTASLSLTEDGPKCKAITLASSYAIVTSPPRQPLHVTQKSPPADPDSPRMKFSDSEEEDPQVPPPRVNLLGALNAAAAAAAQ
ncbi:hypothetical protein PLESTB_001660300, partial [Pleodorina starrii]